MKDKLKGFVFGIVMMWIVMVGVSSFAEMKDIDAFYNGIKILVNGNEIKTDTEPFIYNGRTFVPIRFVAEALGANVSWNESKNQVEVNNEDNPSVNANITPIPAITNSPSPTVSMSPTPEPIIVPTPTPTVSNFIFRKVNWDMTKAQVIASEGKNPDLTDDSVLIYKSVQINNKNTTLEYIINDSNQLSGIWVKVMVSHTNKNDYIDDFYSFNSMLVAKYGTPIINTPTWKNTLFKDDPDDYGLAISAGHLYYLANWELDGTVIYNSLSGENYKIEHDVILKSTVFPQPATSSGI